MPAKKQPACKGCGSTTRALPNPGPRCATCWRTEKKRRSAANHESHVTKTYGLADGEYQQLYEYQGGKCALCRRATGATKRLAVDHHHASGVARMLVCGPCNKLIGHGRDDPAFFRRIAETLDDPPAVRLFGYRGGAEMEIWRPVPGYDGWYDVSTAGRVRSWRGIGCDLPPRPTEPLVLTPNLDLDRGGYGYLSVLSVALCGDGTMRQHRIQRLMAATFCGGDLPDMRAIEPEAER